MGCRGACSPINRMSPGALSLACGAHRAAPTGLGAFTTPNILLYCPSFSDSEYRSRALVPSEPCDLFTPSQPPPCSDSFDIYAEKLNLILFRLSFTHTFAPNRMNLLAHSGLFKELNTKLLHSQKKLRSNKVEICRVITTKGKSFIS